MDFETVKAWLVNQTNKQIRNRWLFASLGLVLLPIATAAGGLLIFAFVRMATRESRDPGIDTERLWITLGIIFVLFIVNLFIPKKEEPETFYSEEGDVPDSLLGSYMHRRKVQGQFILWIILTGPRLLGWSILSFREISRLKRRDTHSCAALLWLLMTKRSKVPYDNIPQELDWLDADTTLSQIKDIPGVLFLKTPPPGVSLSDDLRTAIRTGATI